jgi:MFS family permease
MTETPSPQPQSDAGWFDPAGRAYRFTILFFAGFMIYGSYFAYDAIGAIEDSLMKTLGIGQQEIGTLYGLYSLGPVLFLFAAGMLIDRIGTRKASLIFSGAITLGAILVAIPNLWVMYAGRIIFGFGSEALIVAQSAILARWFSGKELALAFGVALTISRLGTLFSFNTEALIAERLGPFAALWVAAALCAASMLSNLAYVIMDRRAQGRLELKEEAAAGDTIVLGQIKKLGPSFWYVTALCVTFYSAIFPFTALSTNMFHEKWQLPLTAGGGGGFFSEVFSNFWNMFSTAPGTTSIIIFASMVFAPFAGRLVDKVGRRASMMMLGSLMMIPCHLVLGFTELQPLFPMIVLGAAFVLVPAAMWPSVPLLVDKRMVGTAFGVMTQIQNIGLFLFPILNGWLRQATDDYAASMVMFASLGGVGFVFALLLARADRLAGGTLRRP